MTQRPVAFLAVFCATAALAQAPSPSPAAVAPKKAPAGKPAMPSPSPSASGTPEAPKKPSLGTETFGGIRARLIGPAVTSGRVMTIAVHPGNTGIIYIGSASGGVWKTINGGASWQPIFDKEGAFSIGWITLDPNNPSVVWVGTGERNSQRSVAYGDGVYKSEDGGKSWKNMGLKNSEHIGRIVVNPENSDIVYVAAQGPLYAAGGDRGLYKTSDGGKTWEQVLKVSENTGVSDVVLDPRNPNVVIASSYQRRRTFFTLIDGGPESAIHRSTDGGKSWTKVNSGLPSEELGRIGLAISKSNPDLVYANVEAANRKGGIYRSADNGVSWEKRTDYNQGSMYYGDIFVDEKDADRVYVPDVLFQVSDDGAKTFHALGQRYMHVDNHIIWVDPNNANHMLVGNDGGLYRSFDKGATWTFFENLPLAQFYDVDVDQSEPFYNVCGGLQDNNSLCGPSRTRSDHGILNEDWFVTQGGDGFTTHVDPTDPNIIYAELQQGVIVRVDKRTHERVGIQPKEEKGEAPARWNWDTPFIISPHSNTRLYMGSQRLYRTDDRGNSWKALSGDLSRQVDRNKIALMGKVWGPDAVAKNTSTALYGNISAIAESPKKEGLLYVGTDDGLVQVSEDGGANWRKIDAFPGVPKDAYVARIRASQHDAGTAYVAFENHQNGDFLPYLFKTADAGKTWTSVVGDLPKRGSVYAVAEDHVDPNLLFAGTEFAAYFSKDGGAKWMKVAGLPTIAVREIAIQKKHNDLVLGTFGRGIYVVDDYSPLRATTLEMTQKPATLLGARDAMLYVTTQRYGGRAKAFQGEMLYAADNPPYGAVITYYIKDALKTLKQKRVDAEKALDKAGKPIVYPTFDAMRAEAEEEAPAVLLTIADESGTPIRTLTGPATAGFQRVAWDLRYPLHTLPRAARPNEDEDDFFGGQSGPYVIPGSYSVSMAQRVGGVVTSLGGPVSFKVTLDPQSPLTMADHKTRAEFQATYQSLRRSVAGALETANAANTRIDQLKRALDSTPAAPRALHDSVRAAQKRLGAVLIALRGDTAIAQRSEGTPDSISERVNGIGFELSRSLAPATGTHRRQVEIATALFTDELAKLKTLVETDLPALERDAEAAGAPWTVGRIPTLREP
ncbi:MAG: glycosyl hydrolase [Vicinamibacteria bacterium]